MGQLDHGGHVADGIDPGDAGAEVLIHQQAAAPGLGNQLRGEQPVPAGTASDGAQDLFAGHGLFLALLVHMDRQALRRLLHPPDHGGGQHLHPLLFQDLAQVLTQLPVHGGQQPVHALDEGDPAAQVRVKRGKFHADDAATHDHQGLIQAGAALQQLIGGHDPRQVQPRDGRAHRHGAGGRQNAVGGVNRVPLRAGNGDAARGVDAGGALQQVHFSSLQQGVDAAPELFGNGPLIGEHLSQIEGDVPGVDPGRGAVHGVPVYLGGVEQGLGGDAAPVQAGAAYLTALHHGGVQPQPGGLQGGGIAAGPRADNDELIIRHSFFLR